MEDDFYEVASVFPTPIWDMGQFRLHGMHVTLNAG